MRIVYCPAALGHHHHVVTFENACKRAYTQGLNFPAFQTQVGQPEIAVAYHWADLSTAVDHIRACFGPRREHLAPADRSLPGLLLRYALRGLAFNAVTMHLVWSRLAARAERSPAVAGCMRPAIYRGVIAFHFFRGCRHGRVAPGGTLQTQPKQA